MSGNKIVTAGGQPYRLLGVNRSSGEYACVQGKGQWDSGPVDQASVDAMKTWNIHAVRIPLNEECWLGVNGSPSGATYQQGVKDYVNLLVANGINPILDLHWTWGAYTNSPDWHCKDEHAICQKPMPDARYAPQFWTGVANTFKGNDAVVFDLFNEPYPDMPAEWNKTLGWQCLRDGGTCTGIPYEVAGMQDLVDAVRATGATNLLMVSGLEWTNDMREWLAYKPNDPLNNIAASWHAYSFNACANVSCWDSQIAPLAAAGAGRARRVRPGQLRLRLHADPGELGRRARHRLPGLDLEPVGLHHRRRAHQGLDRHTGARHRRGLQGPPADAENPYVLITSMSTGYPPERLPGEVIRAASGHLFGPRGDAGCPEPARPKEGPRTCARSSPARCQSRWPRARRRSLWSR